MSAAADSTSLTREPLADVMLAMDVVDTLRHAEELVSKELNAQERRTALIDRLRRIYRAQGIAVSDEILAQGVDTLEEERFRYEPTAPSLQRSLATAYVRRDLWLRPMLLLLGLLLVIGAFYYLLAVRPAAQEIATLPSRLSNTFAQVVNLSSDPEATSRAQRLLDDARAAIAAGDTEAATARYDELRALQQQLGAEYELRIVVDPRENSGIWRVPSVNSQARNYYLIIEAVRPDGERETLSISSEEDGVTRSVRRWGIRVDELTFESVAADKQDDGIIQNNVVGRKRRGSLEPEFAIPTLGGQILEW